MVARETAEAEVGVVEAARRLAVPSVRRGGRSGCCPGRGAGARAWRAVAVGAGEGAETLAGGFGGLVVVKMCASFAVGFVWDSSPLCLIGEGYVVGVEARGIEADLLVF